MEFLAICISVAWSSEPSDFFLRAGPRRPAGCVKHIAVCAGPPPPASPPPLRRAGPTPSGAGRAGLLARVRAQLHARSYGGSVGALTHATAAWARTGHAPVVWVHAGRVGPRRPRRPAGCVKHIAVRASSPPPAPPPPLRRVGPAPAPRPAPARLPAGVRACTAVGDAVTR